jgi:hypothetical protein
VPGNSRLLSLYEKTYGITIPRLAGIRAVFTPPPLLPGGCARAEGWVVFGLPGNPVSTSLTACRYVRPWLNACMQPADASETAAFIEAPAPAVLTVDINFKPQLAHFVPVRLTRRCRRSPPSNATARRRLRRLGGLTGGYCVSGAATGAGCLSGGQRVAGVGSIGLLPALGMSSDEVASTKSRALHIHTAV